MPRFKFLKCNVILCKLNLADDGLHETLCSKEVVSHHQPCYMLTL